VTGILRVVVLPILDTAIIAALHFALALAAMLPVVGTAIATRAILAIPGFASMPLRVLPMAPAARPVDVPAAASGASLGPNPAAVLLVARAAGVIVPALSSGTSGMLLLPIIAVQPAR